MTAQAIFIYDGDCPLCTNGAAAIRMKKEFGALKIINARELDDTELLESLRERNLDLNEGAVFIYNGNFYFGADALNIIAIMSEPHGLFNNLVIRALKSKNMAIVVYPSLRAIRNFLLFVRGKKPIQPL